MQGEGRTLDDKAQDCDFMNTWGEKKVLYLRVKGMLKLHVSAKR